MELPWIMLLDSTNDLSPKEFERGSCTVSVRGEFCYTKGFEQHNSLARPRTKTYRTLLSEENLHELAALVNSIDSSAPEELWEGMVTDSSPGVLSIFESGHLVRTYCFYEFLLSECTTDPRKKTIAETILWLEKQKTKLLKNS